MVEELNYLIFLFFNRHIWQTNDAKIMIGPLYKYTTSHYLNKFFKTGSLRIGTLHDFRKQEKYGNQIGDSAEGQKTLYIPNNGKLISIDSTQQNTVPNFLEGAIPNSKSENSANLTVGGKGMKFGPQGKIDGNVNIISDGPVSREYNSDDCYVLSLSKIFDRDAMREMGYDACFIINDIEGFIRSISNAIKKLGTLEFINHCTYKPRTIHHEEGINIHPVLLKDILYEYQQEVRIVWKPYHNEIKPFNKDFMNTRRYCSIKHNPLIASATKFHLEVDNEYKKALNHICDEPVSEQLIAMHTTIRIGREKGETVYCWKGSPILTFGNIRGEKLTDRFIHKTYLE